MRLADAARDVLTGTLRLATGTAAAQAALRAHGPRERRRIALTFDDGPAAATPFVLDALSRHGVRATFFVVGMQTRGMQQLVRRTAAEGHELANHSWNHDLKGDWLSDIGQLAVTNATIKHLTGARARLFRPPFGDYSQSLSKTVGAVGLSAVGWDVDALDWRNPGADVIVERVLAGTRCGSIVLLHDGPQVKPVELAAALEELLPRLADRGYECVTVSELLDGALDANGSQPRAGERRA